MENRGLGDLGKRRTKEVKELELVSSSSSEQMDRSQATGCQRCRHVEPELGTVSEKDDAQRFGRGEPCHAPLRSD